MPFIIKFRPAFFCLFQGIVLFLFACGHSNTRPSTVPSTGPCTCIAKVIAADEEAGKTRNHACEKQSLSQTINNYAETINSMVYDGCPADFEQAMLTHAAAWSKLLSFTDLFPESRGEMHDLFTELKSGPGGEAFSWLVDEVWTTWAEVEKASDICDLTN